MEFTLYLKNRIVAKLQTLPTPDEISNNGDTASLAREDPYVELYLDPNCKHSITIKASLGEMWAQMVRKIQFANNFW